MIVFAVSAIFIVGYLLIAFEHKWNLHKALTAGALGGFLWLLIASTESGVFDSSSVHALGGEIFGLIMFLLAAMTLIEILAHYRFFDFVRSRLLGLGFDDRKQLWVIATVAFFLSALIDNLTTAIVMIEIARRFFKDKNMLIAAASIVIAANAGGAWSPIGDVTTIMLWLADKFSSVEVITWGFLPALALFGVSTLLLARRISGDTPDIIDEAIVLSRSEKAVIGGVFLSFPLPLVFSQLGLEPYFGLLFGLGAVGILIALFRNTVSYPAPDTEEDYIGLKDIPPSTHLTADLEKSLARIDMASLLFFAGILLSVGALEHLGILAWLSHALLGSDPSILRLVVGNTSLGAFSAIVDNIPLTAAAIDIIHVVDPAIWVLLALAVGTGGSMLVIGSAAGVVAMGRIRELTFTNYIRYATLPAAVGYLVAIGIWCAQYALFR